MAGSMTVDLSVNRELVNLNFDHYQLSLDPLPSYSTALDGSVDIAKPSEISFSSHHAKLFSLHNSLFSDPWDDSAVYLCDKKWNIVKIVNAGKLDMVNSLCQLPDSSKLCANPSRLNVSLVFPSPKFAVVTNGVDALYIFDTGNRASNTKWKPLHTMPIQVANTALQLLDAVLCAEGENIRLDCLVASVEDVEGETKEKHRSPYITVLDWFTLSSVDGTKWAAERMRRLEGACPIEYACLDGKGEAVHVIAPKAYRMVQDSVKPVDNAEEWDVIGDEVSPSKMYTWSQTVSDLTVHLTVPEGVTKANIHVTFGPKSLEVGIKNSVDMIKGELFAAVDVDVCTWTVDGRRLELTLQKVEEELWSTVVEGDDRGELVMTSDQIEAIHQRLEHLTSEHWNDNPDRFEKPFNAQMLEECDAIDTNGNLIMRLDGESHQMTHKVIATHKFLFSAKLGPDTPPAFCLRHDVDGFLWQAEGGAKVDMAACPWKHVGVLNAFGYVLASKQQQRFVTCSPDMAVAVIADANRHLYLYRQRVETLSPLRNRKTGQQVTSVAKQQVIALSSSASDVILGVRATNTKLFVTTENQVFMYVMSAEE